jgi:hypothetical protein
VLGWEPCSRHALWRSYYLGSQAAPPRLGLQMLGVLETSRCGQVYEAAAWILGPWCLML